MRPSTRPTDEEYRKLLDEKLAPMDKELNELKKKLENGDTGEGDVSIAGAIEKMKSGTPAPKVIKTKAATKVTTETDEVADDGDSGVFCPTCDQGKHEHKVSFGNAGSGKLVGKCTGDECGEEFILVPKKPDYACTTCGLPFKKDINEKNDIKSCPLCGNVRTLGFDLQDKIRMDPYRKTVK